MNYEDKLKFLHTVSTTLERHPELLNEAITALTKGVNDHITKLRHQVADFETIAVGFMSMSKGKYNKKTSVWANSLVLNKLKKYEGHTYVNWTDNISELELRLKATS